MEWEGMNPLDLLRVALVPQGFMTGRNWWGEEVRERRNGKGCLGDREEAARLTRTL